MKDSFTVLVILGWTILGLYFGVAGLTRANMDEALNALVAQKATLSQDSIKLNIDGVDVYTTYELLTLTEVQSVEHYFQWSRKISSFTSLVITALSFGLLGSIIALLKMVVLEAKPLNSLPVFSLPALGFLSGLVIFGLAYLLPVILVEGVNKTRPITLMFLSLFAGLYIEGFYQKVSGYFNKIFL